MRWLRRIGKKPLVERRLDAELQFHIAQQVADYVNSGMLPEEARRRANLEFGGVEQVKEDCRETRWENQLDVFRRDFSFALRSLLKDWRFAFVAIFALALSIGASTAMFSVVDNALFEPFAYKDAHRLVITKVVDLDHTDDYRNLFTIPEIQEIRKQNHVFESVAANLQDDVVNMDSDNSIRLGGNYVTPGSLDVLSVPSFLGRSLEDTDYRSGAPPVFVMRYSTWVAKFNADASLIGKSFKLNGVQRTLVGVMGPRFAWGGADLWMPASYEAAEVLRSGQFDRFWGLIARLKPGVSRREAQADISVIVKRLAPQFPHDYPKHFEVEVESFEHSVVPRQFRSSLYVFMVAVALLLLIGCGNVANLLLARATTREREFAVRSALGASRSRIIRQLLVESFLLAICGAVLGIFLAWAGVRALANSMPEYTIASETVIVMNPAVLAFALVLGVGTIFIFGLVPALQASRRDLQDSLRDAGKGLSGTSRGARLRNSVIIVEVALSLTLVFTAGLFIRSFLSLSRAELGIDIDHVFTARLPLSQARYGTGAQISAFDQALLTQLKSAPGIEYAAVYSALPPFEGEKTEVEVEGKSHSEKSNTIVQVASADYFNVVRLPCLEGRTFSDADIANKRKVAIVNRTFQRRFFQYENPIGRRIHLPEAEKFEKEPIEDAWFEIVGVVADARNRGLRNPLDAQVWVPYPIVARAARTLLVRTTRTPESIAKTVGRVVYELDPTVAMAEPSPLTHYLEVFGLAQPRFGLRLVAVFAVLGLTLVTIGVYSVIAYSTSRRTHEIGIRMALGADGGDVVRMVLRKGFTLLLAGIGIGLAVSLMMARFVAAQLSGISPYDVVTLGTVVALLLGIGLAACWIPARRATRVSPVTALRYE
jgi:putative ABC transport system permease protein